MDINDSCWLQERHVTNTWTTKKQWSSLMNVEGLTQSVEGLELDSELKYFLMHITDMIQR